MVMGAQRLTNIFNTDLKKTMCDLKKNYWSPLEKRKGEAW